MIVGITGTNGSGKGAAVEYLKTKGFVHYSVRDHIVELLKKQDLPIDRPHMGALGDKLRREHGVGYFTEHFIAEMNKNGVTNAVIESIRSVGEAKAFKQRGGALLAVDANPEIRYERIIKRASGTDKLDYDTFVKQEQAEWQSTNEAEMNVPAVMTMADYVIENNGSMSELHDKVDDFLKQHAGK